MSKRQIQSFFLSKKGVEVEVHITQFRVGLKVIKQLIYEFEKQN